MVRQFVDFFDARRFGFNFFPVLGLVVAGILSIGFSAIYNFILSADRRQIAASLSSAFFPALFLGFLLILICHLVKRDAALLIFFPLAYIPFGILNRWLIHKTLQYTLEFSQGTLLSRYVFDPKSMAANFCYAFLLAAVFILAYRSVKRLDLTLFLGFLLAEVLFPFVIFLIRGTFSFRFEDLIPTVVDAGLSGVLFFLGYKLYIHAHGWRLNGSEIIQTAETTAPRTRLLAVGKYFGAFLAIAAVNLVLFGFMLKGLNLIREIRWQTGTEDMFLNWKKVWMPSLLVLTSVVMIVGVIIFVRFIYIIWRALQDGNTRTTPGQAWGFLFLPFFNLYWIFRVTYGFALSHNALVDRHKLNTPKLPAGLFLAFPVLGILDAISFYAFPGILTITAQITFLESSIGLALIYLGGLAVNRIPAEIYRSRPARIE